MRTRWMILLGIVVLAAVSFAGGAGQAQTGDEFQLPGTWHIVLATDDGGREVKAVFQLDGEKVSGKWDETPIDSMGTFKDGVLDLAFKLTVAEINETNTFSLKGKPEGKNLKGEWAFSQYGGAFTANKLDQ